MVKKLLRYLLLSIVFLGFILPYPASSATLTTPVVVEVPKLTPPYNNDCDKSYWYLVQNNSGYNAYLTLNADAANSTNQGEWRPSIPQSGYYRVEAYIANHTAITWCTGEHQTIAHDTSEARYAIRHANGEATRTLSQYLHSNEWLDLGEYYFTAGTSGYVYLSDLNAEAKFTTTVSFSAMRFTFTRLTRPKNFLAMVQQTNPSGTPPSDTGVLQAQGFDACRLPDPTAMQAWWNNSPYSFYALYIGGIHLPTDDCPIATSTWVSAVHQQGWSFVPTWVGPQAPCSDYHYRMSLDPAAAYLEGRQEAQAASSAAASMGLAKYGLGGTIIYYDLEAYGKDSPECRQPVAAFMNGWTERLHELGNLSGGYGTRNSYPWDWAANAHKPDAIWPASWYASSYDAYASVYGISWIQGMWTNHQRIRQYAGGHLETWGGKGNNIDSNVADGVVAMPSTILKPKSIPLTFSSPPIADAGWLTAQQGWLVSDRRLFWTTDQGNHWLDISPGPIHLAAFLPTGEAWALSDPIRGRLTLYTSTTTGSTWKSSEVDLPPGDWSPIQLKFTSPLSGWIVIQKQTSQAFSIGMLLKTTDAGQTWQSYNLPAAGSIHFVSPTEAWLQDNPRDAFFHSLDGGLSWVSENHMPSPLTQTKLPANTTLYSWQTGGLSWAATSTGTCQDEPTSPAFACQVENVLWQSQGGASWQNIALPSSGSLEP